MSLVRLVLWWSLGLVAGSLIVACSGRNNAEQLCDSFPSYAADLEELRSLMTRLLVNSNIAAIANRGQDPYVILLDDNGNVRPNWEAPPQSLVNIVGRAVELLEAVGAESAGFFPAYVYAAPKRPLTASSLILGIETGNAGYLWVESGNADPGSLGGFLVRAPESSQWYCHTS